MEESILLTIKKMLGLDKEYTGFDQEVIVFINTAINELHQIGVSSCDGYMITGVDETWDDIVEEGSNLELIKSYIYIYVRMIFDPPSTGIVSDAMKRSLDRLEWRINVENDPGRNQ